MLQTILDLSQSVGAIDQQLAHLFEGTKENAGKLEKIERDVWTAKVALIVAATIISGVVGFTGWLINSTIRLLPALMSGQ